MSANIKSNENLQHRENELLESERPCRIRPAQKAFIQGKCMDPKLFDDRARPGAAGAAFYLSSVSASFFHYFPLHHGHSAH